MFGLLKHQVALYLQQVPFDSSRELTDLECLHRQSFGCCCLFGFHPTQIRAQDLRSLFQLFYLPQVMLLFAHSISPFCPLLLCSISSAFSFQAKMCQPFFADFGRAQSL